MSSSMYSLGRQQPGSSQFQLGAGWGNPMPAPNYSLSGGTGALTEAPQVPLVSSVPDTQAGQPGMFGGLFDNFFSSSRTVNGIKTDKQGWGMPALGAAQGAFNAWLGMKQYGLAKQQLAEGKNQFGLNYDAQRTTTNAQLEDRQRARLGASGGVTGGYQSVGEYMAQNGIRPRG